MKELHKHWSHDGGREAKIYWVDDSSAKYTYQCFIVEFFEAGQLKETREMITKNDDGTYVVHSEAYAESAAENWCLGYIP